MNHSPRIVSSILFRVITIVHALSSCETLVLTEYTTNVS